MLTRMGIPAAEALTREPLAQRDFTKKMPMQKKGGVPGKAGVSTVNARTGAIV
jgi:hypothetical protein